MKITTWNVNGYRASYGKGLSQFAQTVAPDVLCLQEIKVRPDQLSDEQRNLTGYTGFWNPAERPGYSGVATFFKQPVDKVEFGMGEPRFDQEGRIVRSKHDGFILMNIYFPNGGRGQDRVNFKLDFYANLLDMCDRLMASGEDVILTGDFNTAHTEIDLANPRQNIMNTGFLPEERVWIDYYLEHGFVDAYRELYPSKVEYTWWTFITKARQRNVGWRLDYFLLSKPLMERVRDVVIHSDVYGSDHCPVTLELE